MKSFATVLLIFSLSAFASTDSEVSCVTDLETFIGRQPTPNESIVYLEGFGQLENGEPCNVTLRDAGETSVVKTLTHYPSGVYVYMFNRSARKQRTSKCTKTKNKFIYKGKITTTGGWNRVYYHNLSVERKDDIYYNITVTRIEKTPGFFGGGSTSKYDSVCNNVYFSD